MAAGMNRQILLKSRPEGAPSLDNFELVQRPMPEPADGEVLIRTRYLRPRRIDDVLDACGSPRSRSDWCTAARRRNALLSQPTALPTRPNWRTLTHGCRLKACTSKDAHWFGRNPCRDVASWLCW